MIPHQHRCIHECVCSEYRKWYPEAKQVDELCPYCISCEHYKTPTPSPAAPKKKWETCNQHFTCPNGEECWYLSEDYHNEEKATIRNQTLDAILTCAETGGEWFRIDGTDYFYLNYSVLSNKCESLRTPSTQEHERGDQR